MNRRSFLEAAGAAGVAALAGCTGTGGPSGTTTGRTEAGAKTLRVATYEPFVDAPSSSPGPWLTETFESDHDDVEIEWLTPEAGLNHFIQQRQQDVPLEADLYVGINPDDLIRVDEQLPETSLFDPVPAGSLEHEADLKEHLRFDPESRAVPFDTGIISLVYDESVIDEPASFEDLIDPAFAETLLVQDARTSDPGRAFLLWTVENRGEDSYLEYWEALLENGVRILGDWNAAYTAYSDEERPAVVSYSTDQVYANRHDQDMARHQIGFLDDQGYAVPEGVARFADADQPQLAAEFLDFLLSPAAQAEIAVRNVAFPASTAADLPADFEEYAHRPAEVLSHSYEELEGSLEGWVTDWEQQTAGG